jgi:hypothetical protein
MTGDTFGLGLGAVNRRGVFIAVSIFELVIRSGP